MGKDVHVQQVHGSMRFIRRLMVIEVLTNLELMKGLPVPTTYLLIQKQGNIQGLKEL